MGNYVRVPVADWQSICDAVREKTGGEELLKSGELPEAITNIQTSGEKILYMDAALLDAGGAYPADADDYTTAVIPAEATFVSLEAFDNLPSVEKVIVNGNCEFETYSESVGKNYVSRNAFTISGDVKEIWVEGRNTVPADFLREYYPVSKVHISCDSIGTYPFYDCYALREALVNADSIPSYAFYYCRFLKSVELGDSVASIGDYAFYYCGKLEKIRIPTTVKTIGSSAFMYCNNLYEVEFSEGLETIGQYAFQYCPSLTDVVIPNGVTTIGGAAFYGCTNLATITIPASVTAINNAGGGGSTFPSTTVIRGYAGSYAETWAAENGYTFEVIG